MLVKCECLHSHFALAFSDRYAQERALGAQLELAAEVHLPLVLYCTRAADALAEKVRRR